MILQTLKLRQNLRQLPARIDVVVRMVVVVVGGKVVVVVGGKVVVVVGGKVVVVKVQPKFLNCSIPHSSFSPYFVSENSTLIVASRTSKIACD